VSPTEVIILMLAAAMPIAVVYRALRIRRVSKAQIIGRCPTCGYDLRASKRRCPGCGTPIENSRPRHVPLRDDWPATSISPRSPAPDETPVVAYESKNSLEADLLQEQFQARGIECRLDREEIPGVVYGGVYQTSKLVVWSGDADRARTIAAKLLDRPQG
jgi:hypothetical protein